jgi:hypothetical protein
MTFTCPDGHESDTADYCDKCGLAIAPTQPAPVPSLPTGTAVAPPVGADEELATSPATPRPPCPVCAAPRTGDDRFCEQCGHDFSGQPPGAAEWDAIATADRLLFDRQSTAGVEFPTDYTERRFALDRPQVRIGRSRRGEVSPEIDLGGVPSDPGISHMHAVLERGKDGTYTLRDLGSTNGTSLNDGGTEVGTDTALPVRDGDRIHVGAWTTITLRRRS